MGDGKALQMGTSHELGQNFAKAFDISYSSASGGVEHAWTTSWGTSTRMLGGLIMVHGDDNGLRVPPRLAPIQAYVMVVKDGDGVPRRRPSCATRSATPACGSSSTTGSTPPFGRRAVDAELKGYPVRIEVGPRDLAAGNAVVVRRFDGSKTPVPVGRRRRPGAGRARRGPAADVRRGAGVPRVAHRRGVDAGRRDRGDGDRLGPGAVVGGRRRRRGRGQRPGRDRALPGPRRRLGAGLQDEPDLVAILGRSY